MSAFSTYAAPGYKFDATPDLVPLEPAWKMIELCGARANHLSIIPCHVSAGGGRPLPREPT